MREESTEKRTVPSFGFAERGRASLPDAQRSGVEVKNGLENGLEAHVEAVRYILMASREAKIEIPDDWRQ